MNQKKPLQELMQYPEHKKRVSIIKTMIVKEKSILYEARQINTPELAAGLAKNLYENADREILIICSLDVKSNPMALEIAAIGTINMCIVSPREVFKHAIITNAANIIVFHNHLSGDCNPSKEDERVTNRLIEAGELLGITVLDHIIIGDGNDYYSMCENGFISNNKTHQTYLREK